MTPIQDADRRQEVERSDYYDELTQRNLGIVSRRQQEALRRATVLVAGCGSIGGAAVQPLARLGVQRFLLAEPGTFELNNLNRQQATVEDIGRNKAEVAADRVLGINPKAEVKVFADGVTADCVDELTASCQVVIDGVDVTTMSGLEAKFLLHQKALERRLPLLTGWDMAGVQYLQCYDYRKLTRPFDGRIIERDLDRLGAWQLIMRLIPLRRIPAEMLADVSPNMQNPEYSVPQVVYAALMFGAVSSHMVARILAGEAVRDEVSFDIHQAVRPAPEQWSNRLRWPREALRMVQALQQLARELAR
ncbi:ThiF family adenylyltransferase [Kitasatospora sp. GP82]|uniref:ThiF family adenylyltransferase n=1 Tax=Kitasatospora sp. GP82 TaxID=3035089 RepID=UPI002473035A|nr:ThiF family adenylyltransferase [Kitasatospora sp. GP82]MDH6124048.1 hypothetical protein [Kitasatospora sp. GP82]